MGVHASVAASSIHNLFGDSPCKLSQPTAFRIDGGESVSSGGERERGSKEGREGGRDKAESHLFFVVACRYCLFIPACWPRLHRL